MTDHASPQANALERVTSEHQVYNVEVSGDTGWTRAHRVGRIWYLEPNRDQIEARAILAVLVPARRG